VKEFVEGNDITWSEHIMDDWDQDEGIMKKLLIMSIPSSYIIDENGILIAKAIRSDKSACDFIDIILKNK
jgi:hypothetical protein